MRIKRFSRRALALASAPISPARKIAAALITFSLLPVVYLASAEAAVMELRVSSTSNRSAATALAGASVAGNVYVFVPRDEVSRVEFWVDDPATAGSRYSLDRRAEFDLAGTLRSGLARPFDTTNLVDGSHTVTARVRRSDGTISILNSTFTVANQPTPTTSTTTAPTTTTTTTAPAPSYVDRVSAGSGADVTDGAGNVWSADRGFAGGSVLHSGVHIAGTDDDFLYTKHRWGMTGYALPVPCAATYRVDLHLAEVASLTAGQRVFDVKAEGTTVVSRLDVAAEAGWGTAFVRSFDVAVGDGTLDLGFVAVVEDPMISAVAVHQVSSCGATTTTTTTAPPTTTTTTAPSPTTTTTTAAPVSSPTTTTTTAPPATSSSGGCPAYPAFPDGNCTGWRHTGVTLSSYTGPTYITASGTVIDGKLINGDLTIRASNVTIRRSQVNGTINLGYAEASNVLIEDVEVNAGNTTFAAIGSSNFTCRRCNIYGGGQGINGYNFTVEDSWIHDLYGTGTVHSEAILGYGGNIVVRHNRLSGNYNSASGNFAASDGGMSSSVSFYTHGSWGPINDVIFEKNRLNVGSGDRDYAGYCLYGGGSLMHNGTFRDNVFARHPLNTSRCGYHGTATDLPSGSGSTWTNNRYEDGTPL